MKKAFKISAGFLFSMVLLAGCGMSVQRVSSDTVSDISDKWNDTDASQVAQGMVSECLSEPWLANAQAAEGHNPSVIIGTIHNKSMEHIDTDTFTEDIQRELINSGKVKFVASSAQRGEIRGERLDQDLNASAETRKAMGQETGADFMMQGTLDAIQQQEGGKEVMFYEVNLQLINLATNDISWIGQKKIKKLIKRPGYSL